MVSEVMQPRAGCRFWKVTTPVLQVCFELGNNRTSEQLNGEVIWKYVAGCAVLGTGLRNASAECRRRSTITMTLLDHE
ncbi:MAG: hypothetical protein EA364_07420 [Balneolaceae bacterium]|nr:MAG: hypothetical protein EA364_07420 [Balneolaceae bacterium]